MHTLPEITIQQGDVTQDRVDLLVLKFAQAFYGADSTVADLIGVRSGKLVLDPWEVSIFETKGAIPAPRVAFIGTPRLGNFRYKEIRRFGFAAAKCATENASSDMTIAMTIHGAGYGLDEQEAFSAQVAGIVDFLEKVPGGSPLPHFRILERNAQRAARLTTYLAKLKAEFESKYPTVSSPQETVRTNLLEAGETSEAKRHVFVAIPYTPEMEDVYEFGIRQPVKEADFLCERCDRDVFTGDILGRIKNRITDASLVIADVSGANPNVYLEVGYAWGKEVPTLLAAKEGEELKFDVKGQKCLYYRNINDLRQKVLDAIRILATKA